MVKRNFWVAFMRFTALKKSLSDMSACSLLLVSFVCYILVQDLSITHASALKCCKQPTAKLHIDQPFQNHCCTEQRFSPFKYQLVSWCSIMHSSPWPWCKNNHGVSCFSSHKIIKFQSLIGCQRPLQRRALGSFLPLHLTST